MGAIEKLDRAVPGTMAKIMAAVSEINAAAAKEEVPRIRVEHERPMPQIVMPAPYITRRHAESTFENYRAESESERHALKATQHFCARVLEGKSPMLALIGEIGTGKSHLLYAAARYLYQADRRVFSRPWYRLADHLRYGGPALFTSNMIEPHELRESIMGEEIVMIDEVRPTAGTAFDDTELAKICCNAYDNGRAMLITTNVSPLSDVLGAAPASRFNQVTIVGRDRRQS